MDFDEAKQLLKEAIDESETSGDILRILVEKIYQKGKQDCLKDCCEKELSKKEREIISLALIVYDSTINKQGNFEGLPTRKEVMKLYYKILESK